MPTATDAVTQLDACIDSEVFQASLGDKHIARIDALQREAFGAAGIDLSTYEAPSDERLNELVIAEKTLREQERCGIF